MDTTMDVSRLENAFGEGKDSYYVYMLCEKTPEKLVPFYIGKGKGARVFHHQEEALCVQEEADGKIEEMKISVSKERYLSDDEKNIKIELLAADIKKEVNAKCDKINSLGKDNIEKVIIKWGLTEKEAFMSESALINMYLYMNGIHSMTENKKEKVLTNIVNGHMSKKESANISHETRAWSTDEFLKECAVPRESIMSIEKNVRFVFIGDSWPACKDLVTDDIKEQRKAIRDCASAAWRMGDAELKNWESIHIFALYKSQVVGTYKLKSKPKRRCELEQEDYERFPKYPKKVRQREKIYTEYCAKLSSFKEAKECCESNDHDGLNIEEFCQNIIQAKENNEQAYISAFEKWKDRVFFDLEDEEVPEFTEKKELLIPNKGINDVSQDKNCRRFNIGDIHNFYVKNGKLRVKELDDYKKKNSVKGTRPLKKSDN